MLIIKPPIWSQKMSLKNSETKFAELYVRPGLSFVETM